MKDKDHYVTMIAPGTKKVSVCSRRAGPSERMIQIALCSNEGSADLIVEALNYRAGKIEKLEVPLAKQLDQTREALAEQRKLHAKYHVDCTALQHEKSALIRERDELKRQLARATLQLDTANRDIEMLKKIVEEARKTAQPA